MSADRLERRNYKKVYARLWEGAEFQALPETEKLLTLYVLSGPQTNRIGLFKLSFGQAGEHLSAEPKRLVEAMAAICAVFEWQFDSRAKVIWIPSWWTFNPVKENTQNLKGYLSDLNTLPRTALIGKFCRNLVAIPDALHALFDGWEEALTPVLNTVPHTALHTVPDRGLTTETETETETETVGPRTKREAAPDPQPVRPAFERYQERFVDRYHGKPEIAGGKDGGRMRKLLVRHGLDEVLRRLDAFFETSDVWIQQSGHTLDVFFSTGTQTKLVAEAGRARTREYSWVCRHEPRCGNRSTCAYLDTKRAAS